MDIDDEIVEECDVYLNKSLSKSLHVFQFASRESPLSESTIRVRARPSHRLFTIEIPFDIDADNYDRRKCEHMTTFGSECEVKSEAKGEARGEARAEPKGEAKSEHESGAKLMTTNVLKSCGETAAFEQYCIALVRSDCSEVHVTPLNSVIQFKPSFHYVFIDKTQSKHKSNNKTNVKRDSDTEMSCSEEVEPNVDVQAITMRFAGPDEERIKKAREKSFNFLQQQLAKDPWIDVSYHSIDSERSASERTLLSYNSSRLNKANESLTANNNCSFKNLEQFLTNLKNSSNHKV